MDKIKTFLVVFLAIALSLLLYYCMTTSDQEHLGSAIVYNKDWGVISSGKQGIPNIPPRVVEYHRNSKHIIVKQRPYQFAPDIDGWRNVNYPNGYDTTYYWLIVKTKHLFIGPLDSIQFIKAREDYHVSERLLFDVP